MATLIRGKRKGEVVTIKQWCNNWVSVEGGDFYAIVSPTSLQFDHKEMMAILLHNNNGTLLEEYEATFDLRFKKRKVR